MQNDAEKIMFIDAVRDLEYQGLLEYVFDGTREDEWKWQSFEDFLRFPEMRIMEEMVERFVGSEEVVGGVSNGQEVFENMVSDCDDRWAVNG